AEPGVAHHLWFLLRFGQGRTVVLMTPSASSQDSVVLRPAAAEAVVIGNRTLQASHWEVRAAADGSLRWEFWADAAGRILRARHPATGLEVLRDDPPAETPVR